jgi:hypothetical protein
VRDSVYLPFDTQAAAGARLRAEDWRTVRALAPDADAKGAALDAGCSHILENGKTERLR